MSYPDGSIRPIAPHYGAEHITRPGWRAVGAIASRDTARGGRAVGDRAPTERTGGKSRRRDTGGHRLRLPRCPRSVVESATATWTTARRGAGDYIERVAADYFELTELHVPPLLRAGIGGHLLTRLLADRPEASVLSTPENPIARVVVVPADGFADVLRNFFAGDPRPFAFLGRPCPC